MNYKHPDGSYSTFGPRYGQRGNTWWDFSVICSSSTCSLSQLRSYDRYHLMVNKKCSCRPVDFSELLWALCCLLSEERGCISQLCSWSISSPLAATRTMMDKKDRQKQSGKGGRRDFTSQMKKAEELQWQLFQSRICWELLGKVFS